mmetsp:Transcript_69011/g.218260  ORF Transcript_69011/g.218260 Transcript_69011/m.218260 type:complete len:297 (+) Transcript_69011:155-1045(+)
MILSTAPSVRLCSQANRTAHFRGLPLPAASGACDVLRFAVGRLYVTPRVQRATGITMALKPGDEMDLQFTGLPDEQGMMTVAGFGSLLSERSALVTFPALSNFRAAKLRGWRRVFAHTAPIFFERGIARMDTKEISSLSVEPCEGESIVVSLFEVEATEASIAAFIEREHEFRFVAVMAEDLLTGAEVGRPGVLCARYTDEEYRRVRCGGDASGEYERRYGRHGIDKIWRDDLLPCRTYLRHCVLASQRLGPEAYASFLDDTYLGDRTTTIRSHLAADPSIMEELPPPELVDRYSG